MSIRAKFIRARFIRASFFTLISLCSLSAIAEELIPVDAFTKASTYDDIIISPDGKHLAVKFKFEGIGAFGVLNRKDLTVVSSFQLGEFRTEVGDIFWIDNKRLVYTKNKKYAHLEQPVNTGELYAVNLDGSQATILVGFRAGQKQTGSNIKKRKDTNATAKIISLLPDDPRNILISLYPWKLNGNTWYESESPVTKITRLNIFTGKQRKIDRVSVNRARLVVDDNDLVRVAIGTNKDFTQVVKYRKNKKAPWEDLELPGLENSDLNLVSISKDNQRLYVTASQANETNALFEYDLATMTGKEIYQHPEVDIYSGIMDKSDNRIVAVATENGLPDYHYIDSEDPRAKVHKMLRKAFKGSDIYITSETEDGSEMIVRVYADTNPGDFYIFNTKTKQAAYLASRKRWIDPEQMATSTAMHFPMRDGSKISGYFVQKDKNEISPSALVVMPHGGPHGIRDYWMYRSQVQWLASRGYNVLQVNFRGSGGYGDFFEEKGYGEWGALMQDDVTDATKHLIEQKLADPTRICIMGGSYGGYSAMMGAIREPDLYKCAISSAAVYDLKALFTEGNVRRLGYGAAYLKKALGEDDALLKARSPRFNADKVNIPLLMIHGKRDEQAPYDHAKETYKELKKLGKPVTWMPIAKEGHGYYAQKNRIKVFEAIVEFLDGHIGN